MWLAEWCSICSKELHGDAINDEDSDFRYAYSIASECLYARGSFSILTKQLCELRLFSENMRSKIGFGRDLEMGSKVIETMVKASD